MRVDSAMEPRRITRRSTVRATKVVTNTNTVTTTMPLTSSHSVNMLRPGIRCTCSRVAWIFSSQPSSSRAMTSHTATAMRPSQASNQVSRPSIRRMP